MGEEFKKERDGHTNWKYFSRGLLIVRVTQIFENAIKLSISQTSENKILRNISGATQTNVKVSLLQSPRISVVSEVATVLFNFKKQSLVYANFIYMTQFSCSNMN